jgi:plastocyanin
VFLLGVALLLVGCGASGGGGNPYGAAPTATAATTATATTATATATSTASGGSTAAVSIGSSGGYYGTFKFAPGTLTVKVGTAVVWTNPTGAPHTVTSDSGDPASFNGMLNPNGGTYRFTFTQPGTYTYHCSVHPYMTATITVAM